MYFTSQRDTTSAIHLILAYLSSLCSAGHKEQKFGEVLNIDVVLTSSDHSNNILQLS